MKKTLLAAVTAIALGVTAHGQGQIDFNNTTSGAITAQGGGFAGAPFQVSLYWVAGAFVGTADALISSGTYFAANAPVLGSGPLTEPNQSNGAGIFFGGVINIPGTSAGTYTFVAVAYSGAASYSAALANPVSWVGNSAPFTVTLVTGATPPNTTIVPTFMVVPVPEPSSFALAGLGLAGLLIFRRRK